MNNQNRRPVWLRDPLSTFLFFLILNSVTVMSPLAFSIAPVILPVLLLHVLHQTGRSGFLAAALASALPYLVLGGISSGFALMVPVLIMLGAVYLIWQRQLSWRWSILAASLALLIGLLLNAFVSIYLISGSDILRVTSSVAENVRNELTNALAASGYEIPLAQQQLIEQLKASVTPELVQDLIPTLLICWSLIGGYLTLRFARRYLPSALPVRQSVPWFAMLRIHPVLLMGFISLAMGGYLMAASSPRWGSLLFNTGYGVTLFLGMTGSLTFIWWSLSVNFRMRRRFPKMLLTLLALFYLPGEWMILAAIIDSVLDFRNASGHSLWRWMTYQLTARAGKGE
ncbi:DUF2232 domain-containing protein [Proteiniclasticum sp. QWL-01]|uniref:DUF2232 domain-containing protein n=1 Tax=Proteiniclasticum sp. QWL-01 TaxID=3036945 RepID=UPI00220AADF6|nr:DUF2232 domain-containing protein [Proteiniclasticum sp. QWL-01]UUM11490.1 DUF2232 domain-containing protein [Clostridiaceae bacterium HFYG-1003]WFF72941.1 DUF2232 domain-containing protein [Proteiniclasticum sp. QWL-01]